MKDRFKFRAGFTISFYDIAGNDVERQIMLDNCFSIDNGGEGICVNEEIIQEALDIYVAKDEHKSAWDFINANYAETDGYYFIDSVDFLDQCTGLRDKNGKLIYENDVVKVSEAYENGIYKIEFCQSDCEYNLYNSKGNFMYQLTKSMARYMEVIGNIHENADLIKVGRK